MFFGSQVSVRFMDSMNENENSKLIFVINQKVRTKESYIPPSHRLYLSLISEDLSDSGWESELFKFWAEFIKFFSGPKMIRDKLLENIK